MNDLNDRPPKQSTIYDVAKRAGVSHQTVARIVRGYEGFRPETRERVAAAIAELAYVPNVTARSLATKRPRRIAALTYEMDQVGPNEVVRGASHAAREAGYLLDIVTLELERDDSIDEAVDLINQQDLAGVIALIPTEHIADAVSAAHFRVPLFMDRSDSIQNPESGLDLGAAGVHATTQHLLSLGHSRLFHIGGPSEWLASRSRLAAFESVIRANGFEPVGARFGGWSASSGYEIGLGLPVDELTAVVAANDQIALGAIHALRQRGIRVPEQLSITGIDDIAEAAYFWPPLTTAKLDLESVGRRGVQRLLTVIDPEEVRTITDPAPAELRVRKSTAAPRT
ncbi:LacI family DNA-binding transcriptional regulator [Agromyces italicus]|uniref:LacI family DNA-binding transcriptional regulator n=1 Tax=Agromyces italicus TaxID=279572 RepID=UPI0003B642D4|nr:LacI family DNA-binding transcriptional regulator [Agromyces italicus]